MRPTFALTAGTHHLRLYPAELGVKMDRILLTANPDFIPDVQTFEPERPAS